MKHDLRDNKVLHKYRCVAQLGRALRSGRRGRRFESCHLDHNRTPILIQCVSELVFFFMCKSLVFTRVYLHFLTIAGSAAYRKRSLQSLLLFIPTHILTKSREGVHFQRRGVHFIFFVEFSFLKQLFHKS